jgi:hypothetical protein
MFLDGSRVQKRQYVSVVQFGRNLDFPEESFFAYGSGEFGPKDFYGHLAIVLDIVGQVHRCHAAGAKFPFNAVAVG